MSFDFSEIADSTLAESSGTSFEPGREPFISMAGVIASCGWGGQQKVSRFHNRQLRFSYRRPSGIELEHFENTVQSEKSYAVSAGGNWRQLSGFAYRFYITWVQ